MKIYKVIVVDSGENYYDDSHWFRQERAENRIKELNESKCVIKEKCNKCSVCIFSISNKNNSMAEYNYCESLNVNNGYCISGRIYNDKLSEEYKLGIVEVSE